MKRRTRTVSTQPTTSQSSGDNSPEMRAHRLVVDLIDADVASSFTGKFSIQRSRMDLVRPKKLIGRNGIDRDRNDKKRSFDRGKFQRTIAQQQKKHPRQKHHRVTVRKFPASGISVRPKGKGE